LLTSLSQKKIPEIEEYLEEIKAAEKEGDIERLELNAKRLDNTVYKLWVEVYFLMRKQRMKG
jgi:hypothetical protein